MVLLLPLLLSFALVLRNNFIDASLQDVQKNLSALMYQTDRLVLDIDLELSFMEVLLSDALFSQDGTAQTVRPEAGDAFDPILAEYRAKARWPDLLTAAYLVENRAGQWTIRPLIGNPAQALAADSILDRIRATLLGDPGEAGLAGNKALPTGLDKGLFRLGPVMPFGDPRPAASGPPAGDGPGLRLFVAFFDEAVFLEQVLPNLVARYFGSESDFPGFAAAVYRPNGELAFVAPASQAVPSSALALQSESAETSRVGAATLKSSRRYADFMRPLFRDPARFDIARLYRGAAIRLLPPSDLEAAGGRLANAGAWSNGASPEQRRRSLQDYQAGLAQATEPDYIEQYRFYTPPGQALWQLALFQEGRTIAEAARRTANWYSLAALAGLLSLYAVCVLLFLTLHRTRALAERERAFFASVSHELKTPIAVVRSAGENLAKGIVPAERVAAYGEVLAGEAKRLGASVERLLVIAGLQSARNLPSGEPIGLGAACQAVLQKRGLAADWTLIQTGDPLVAGSSLLLESAIDSLISNALNYGAPPYRLELAEYQAGGRHVARLCCVDHGPGVPRAERRRLFEPFFRGAAASSRHCPGTGVGLYLVRRVARIHGGDARLQPSGPAGTVFEMTFKAYP